MSDTQCGVQNSMAQEWCLTCPRIREHQEYLGFQNIFRLHRSLCQRNAMTTPSLHSNARERCKRKLLKSQQCRLTSASRPPSDREQATQETMSMQPCKQKYRKHECGSPAAQLLTFISVDSSCPQAWFDALIEMNFNMGRSTTYIHCS